MKGKIDFQLKKVVEKNMFRPDINNLRGCLGVINQIPICPEEKSKYSGMPAGMTSIIVFWEPLIISF